MKAVLLQSREREREIKRKRKEKKSHNTKYYQKKVVSNK